MAELFSERLITTQPIPKAVCARSSVTMRSQNFVSSTPGLYNDFFTRSRTRSYLSSLFGQSCPLCFRQNLMRSFLDRPAMGGYGPSLSTSKGAIKPSS